MGAIFRTLWKAFCAIVGGLILGAGVGFWSSSLWLGLAAAVPGLIAGWVFGKHISPLEAFFSPFDRIV
jgi:hypothetical protein